MRKNCLEFLVCLELPEQWPHRGQICMASPTLLTSTNPEPSVYRMDNSVYGPREAEEGIEGQDLMCEVRLRFLRSEGGGGWRVASAAGKAPSHSLQAVMETGSHRGCWEHSNLGTRSLRISHTMLKSLRYHHAQEANLWKVTAFLT